MQPSENLSIKSYTSAWHPTGLFGARERLDINIENNHLNIQVIAQSAFAHAVIRFIKFFGGKVQDDLWKTIKTTESRDLTATQIDTFLTRLPSPSTVIDAKILLKKIHEEILPDLELLKNAAISNNITEKAEEESSTFKRIAEELEATISQTSENTSSEERKIIPHISYESQEGMLSKSIESVQQATVDTFLHFIASQNILTEQESSSNEGTNPQQELAPPPPIAILETIQHASHDQVMADLKATMRKIKDNAIQVLGQLKEEESIVNSNLEEPSIFINEIKKVRIAVQNILKLTDNQSLNENDTVPLKEQLAYAQTLYGQTEQWITDVKSIHATTIKISALERKLDEILQQLEDPAIPPATEKSDWQIQLSELRNATKNITSLEQALEEEKKFDDLMNEICKKFIDFSSEHFKNQQKALDGITNEAVQNVRKKTWDRLEKHRPSVDTDWYTLFTWYTVLEKTAAIDSALNDLLAANPKSSFAELVLTATKQTGDLGTHIIALIAPQVDEEIFRDDINPEKDTDIQKFVGAIQDACNTMSGDQNLTINSLHNWTSNLLSLTDKSQNIYNFSILTDDKLSKNFSKLEALSSSINVLIECYNSQHDDYFAEKAKKRSAFLIEDKETPMSQYFDAIMQKLRSTATWNPAFALADLPNSARLWNSDVMQAKSMINSLKELSTHYSDLKEKTQKAYDQATKAPVASQQEAERKELDNVVFPLINLEPSPQSRANVTLQDIQAFSVKVMNNISKIQKIEKDIQYRNEIRKQILAKIEEGLNTVDSYRKKIRDIEEWFDISLMHLVEARLKTMEENLMEAKSYMLPPPTTPSVSPPTYSWWQKITSFGGLTSRAVINPLPSQGPTLNLNTLLDWENQTHQLVLSLEDELKSHPIDEIYQFFTSIKEQDKRIKSQMDSFNKSGQIIHADSLLNESDPIQKSVPDFYKSTMYQPLLILNDHISPFESLKLILPHTLDRMLELSKRISKLPYYELLSLISKANSQEKAAYLQAALVKEIQEKISVAQENLKKSLEETYKKIDDAHMDSVLKNHLDVVVRKNNNILENLKVNVTLQRGGISGFGGLSETVSVDNLSLDDTLAYNKQVTDAIAKGNDAIKFAASQIEKLETAELTYKATLEEAEERSAWLEKTHQLASQHELQKVIDTIKLNYKEKYRDFLTNDPTNANLLSDGLLSKAGQIFGSFTAIAKYNNFIGKQTAKLIEAIATARDAPIYSFYPDQLAIRNLPNEVAAEIRQRYTKFIHGEIARCISDLNKYRELAKGPLGLYIDSHSLWQMPKTKLGWFKQKFSQSNSNLSLDALIDYKIKQMEDLKFQFEQEGGLLNFYRPVNVMVNTNMSAATLKNYNTAVQNMKGTLTASLEKEMYLSTTSKYLNVFIAKLAEAKAFADTLREKEQFKAEYKLLSEIERIEEEMKNTEGTLCSYRDMYNFCQKLQNNIQMFQTAFAQNRYAKEESILEQLASMVEKNEIPQVKASKSDSRLGGLITKLFNSFIKKSKEIIAAYKEKIGELEKKATELFENGIIATNLETSFKSQLAKEKFVGIAAFDKPQSVKRQTFWGQKDELKYLQDLYVNELTAYDEKLRTRALEFDNGAFNEKCELVKINEDTHLESLHSALYGNCDIGYNKTLIKLNEMAAKVDKHYEDPKDQEVLKNKINALTKSTGYIIETLAKGIASTTEMRIAANAVKAQVGHLNTIIGKLKEQIKKNEHAKRTGIDKSVIPIKLPPLAHMGMLQRDDPNYTTNKEYLSARWEFLTGQYVEPEHIKAATDLLADTTPQGVATLLDAAAKAATANPAAAVNLLDAVQNNNTAAIHINNAAIVPPAPPAAHLAAAAALALGGLALVPAPPPVISALAALAMVSISNKSVQTPYQKPIAPASPPAKGSPYYNAFKMYNNLHKFNIAISAVLGDPNLSPFNKDQAQKLRDYVQTNANLFLLYHQGIPAYAMKTVSFKTPLASMKIEKDFTDYVLAMQRHYAMTIDYIQTQVQLINHKSLKLRNWHKGIEWKY